MPTEPTVPLRYKIEQHVQGGMLLEERIVEQGAPPADFVYFAGTLLGRTQTPMGIMEERIQFPIIAKTVDEAYVSYKDAAHAFLRAKQAAQSQQIAVPQKPKGLILPG